jgi:hypothetical protein
MRHFLAAAILISALAGLACDDDNGPGTPSPTVLNIAGNWSGDLLVQNVATRMTWTLAQAGTSVTGTALVQVPTGTVLLNATLSGTLSGSTLAYTMIIGPGGVPSQPTCTGQIGGAVNLVGTAPVTALTGTYTVVSSTCPLPFTSGAFTLTR